MPAPTAAGDRRARAVFVTVRQVQFFQTKNRLSPRKHKQSPNLQRLFQVLSGIQTSFYTEKSKRIFAVRGDGSSRNNLPGPGVLQLASQGIAGTGPERKPQWMLRTRQAELHTPARRRHPSRGPQANRLDSLCLTDGQPLQTPCQGTWTNPSLKSNRQERQGV